MPGPVLPTWQIIFCRLSHVNYEASKHLIQSEVNNWYIIRPPII